MRFITCHVSFAVRHHLIILFYHQSSSEKNICQKKKAPEKEKAHCASKPTDNSNIPSAQICNASTEMQQTDTSLADETQKFCEIQPQISSFAESTTSQNPIVVVVTKESKSTQLGLLIDRAASKTASFPGNSKRGC